MDSRVLMTFLVLPVLGYLLGSIPFGLLIGLARGVDVRRHGSGNIGSTNVGRVLGRRWGLLSFFLDVAKGLVPVWYAGVHLREAYGVAADEALPVLVQLGWLLVGAGCILGHMFSVYLGFRGGKGVATSLGVVLGIWPYFTLTGLVAFAVWVAIWGVWRYVSLASLGAAVAFPVVFLVLIGRVPKWHVGELWPLVVFGGLMAVLVIVRHRGNIGRLLAGTESRGGRSGR